MKKSNYITPNTSVIAHCLITTICGESKPSVVGGGGGDQYVIARRLYV